MAITWVGALKMNSSKSAEELFTVQSSTKLIWLSILVDGTPDFSHTDQITFVLRFVFFGIDKSWTVKERFLRVENLEKKKGADIAKLIMDVLEQNGIDLKNCRGQGYDNGANMSGIYKGVQEIILQKILKLSICHAALIISTLLVSILLNLRLKLRTTLAESSHSTIFSVEALVDGNRD